MDGANQSAPVHVYTPYIQEWQQREIPKEKTIQVNFEPFYLGFNEPEDSVLTALAQRYNIDFSGVKTYKNQISGSILYIEVKDEACLPIEFITSYHQPISLGYRGNHIELKCIPLYLGNPRAKIVVEHIPREMPQKIFQAQIEAALGGNLTAPIKTYREKYQRQDQAVVIAPVAEDKIPHFVTMTYTAQTMRGVDQKRQSIITLRVKGRKTPCLSCGSLDHRFRHRTCPRRHDLPPQPQWYRNIGREQDETKKKKKKNLGDHHQHSDSDSEDDDDDDDAAKNQPARESNDQADQSQQNPSAVDEENNDDVLNRQAREDRRLSDFMTIKLAGKRKERGSPNTDGSPADTPHKLPRADDRTSSDTAFRTVTGRGYGRGRGRGGLHTTINTPLNSSNRFNILAEETTEENSMEWCMEDNQLIGNKTRRTLPEGALGGNKEGGSQLLDSQLPCGQTTFSTANENAHQEVDDLNDLLSFPSLKSNAPLQNPVKEIPIPKPLSPAKDKSQVTPEASQHPLPSTSTDPSSPSKESVSAKDNFNPQATETEDSPGPDPKVPPPGNPTPDSQISTTGDPPFSDPTNNNAPEPDPDLDSDLPDYSEVLDLNPTSTITDHDVSEEDSSGSTDLT